MKHSKKEKWMNKIAALMIVILLFFESGAGSITVFAKNVFNSDEPSMTDIEGLTTESNTQESELKAEQPVGLSKKAERNLADSPPDLNRASTTSVTTSRDAIQAVSFEFQSEGDTRKDQTTLELRDVELYTGQKFNPRAPFHKLLDKNGRPLILADIEEYFINGIKTKELNTEQAGIHEVQVKYEDAKGILRESNKAKITVKQDQTVLELKGVELYTGETYDPNSIFKNVVNQDGKKLTAKDFFYESSSRYYTIYPVDPISGQLGDQIFVRELNTAIPGNYRAILTYSWNWKFSNPVDIKVKQDQTKLELQNIELYVGEKFDPKAPIKKLVDKDGRELTLNEIDEYFIDGVKTKELNTKKAGVHEVQVKYKDAIGNVRESNKAKIIIKADQTTLELQNIELYTGEQFDPNMPFKNVIDKDGKQLKAEDFPYYYIYPSNELLGSQWLTQKLNTKKPGNYKVRVFYTGNRKYSNEATITVKQDQTTLDLQDIELYTGEQFKPAMPFKKVIDKTGRKLEASDIEEYFINGIKSKTLNTEKAGSYDIQIKYKDAAGRLKESNKIKATIKQDQTSLELKAVELYTNEQFDPSMPFKNVQDKEGKKLTANDIDEYFINSIKTKEINTEKAGSYDLQIRYKDAAGKWKESNKVKLTIKQDQTTLELQNVELYTGEAFDPNSPFKNVKDRDGRQLKAEDFVYYYIYPVKNQVGSEWLTKELNTEKPGSYKVRVFYTGNRKYSNEAIITVKQDQTKLELQNVELYTGEVFDPNVPFKNVTDRDGVKLKAEEIEYYYIYPLNSQLGSKWLTKELNTQTPGTYKVRIFYTGNRKYSNEATITVKQDQTNLELQDIELYTKERFDPNAVLKQVIDKDGKKLTANDIDEYYINQIKTKTLSTEQAATFEVQVKYRDAVGILKESNKAKITIQEKLTADPVPYQTTLDIGTDHGDTKRYVKNVRSDGKLVSEDDYSVSVVEHNRAEKVGEFLFKVRVRRTSTNVEKIIEVPMQVSYGKTLILKGLGLQTIMGVSTHFYGNNYYEIEASRGTDLDAQTQMIHPDYLDNYFSIELYPIEKQNSSIQELKNPSYHFSKKGIDQLDDAYKSFKKQRYQPGDIIKLIHKESLKNSEFIQLWNDGVNIESQSGYVNQEAYYELTRTNGFKPLKINQLVPRITSTFLYVTKEELTKDLKKNMKKYFEANEYESLQPVGFVQFPDTKTPGIKKAIVRIEEELTTGKKIQQDYELQLNIKNEWVNVTLPTKMLFFSDTKMRNKIVSQNYSIRNNSERTFLEVELASFSAGKVSGVNYLSEKETDPSGQSNSIRLNLAVNGKEKINSLNESTAAAILMDLAPRRSGQLKLTGKYFNDQSEKTTRLENSIILKFNIKE